ncbi:MAG: PAS domain S-box protein [Pelagibaca sp.]
MTGISTVFALAFATLVLTLVICLIAFERQRSRLRIANLRLKTQASVVEQTNELAGLGTWVILSDLRSFRASKFMKRILGFSENDDIVEVDALRSRIVPEDRPAFDAAFQRAVTENRTAEVEFRAVGASGDTRIFRAMTGPNGAGPNDDEDEGGISGIIQDITDLRQNETALEQSRKLERLAGDVARIGGWGFNIETREFSGTRDTMKLIAIDSENKPSIDVITQRFLDQKDRAHFEQSFWTCVGTGSRFDQIARFLRFDGKETWLRMIGEAQFDASGAVVSIHGALQDVNELIEAQHAREESRTLLEKILDSLGDGFVIHDHDGTIQYMNCRAHAIMNAPAKNLVGSNIWENFSNLVGSQFEQVVNEALETGESQTFEGEVWACDQWISVAVHPTSAGVAIYLRDTTEERASRMRLRLLDAAISQISDIVLVTDATCADHPGTRVTYVNDAFESMTGYSKDEILGHTPFFLQGPETELDRLDEIRQALENQRSIRTELTNYRKDGSRFSVELDISPLFDANGTCTHFVSVHRDTTERRQVEENLRVREEQFRLAGQASRDIIWDWDIQSGKIFNSVETEPVLGTSSQILVEIPQNARIEDMLERIHQDDRLKVTESLDAVLASQSDAWRCEYRVKAANGSWRTINDNAFVVRDKNGTPRRMVGAMSDVTDLRLLDAQLHLAKNLETVGELTGGIAHDFNNLLTIILGNCDILLEDLQSDAPQRSLVKSIDVAAERGARVSRDLLAFSGRQPLAVRATDINNLIQQSFNMFERAVDESTEICYDLAEEAMVANVDPDKLQTALMNLILNARAAIPHKGTITVRTRPTTVTGKEAQVDVDPGDYITIDIVDDGTGMIKEISQRAFEPFFTTKEPGVGTGMGLSSVYGFVKQSGGHAMIESEPGRGTTVTLCLPMSRKQEATAPASAVPATQTRRRSNRILVVEDDTDLRVFVRTVLGRIGYQVVQAEDGEQALAILQKDGDFDLVFTDIVMPKGVNGVQLARKTLELYPELKVLFTSGYTRDALGKDRHLPNDIPMLYKPFRANELIGKVDEVLKAQSA